MEKAIGMALEFLAAFILILVFICCVSEKKKTPLLKNYIYMVLSCIVALLSEAVTLALYEKQGVDIWLLVLNTISLISGYALAFSYTWYIANLVGPERRYSQRAMKIVYWFGNFAVLILLAGNFFGWFFKVENGVFIPSNIFVIVFAYDVIACIIGMLLIEKYKKYLQLRDILALLSFPVMILLSAILQYIIYKVSVWLFLMAMISVFMIYLMIQTDRNKRQAEQEKQLVDMNIAMLLSQIQPHFLYNSLSSIRRMIKKDPEVAENAVENFSLYLRQNLESMNRVEPIPFATELKHLKEYLYLEKLRFGERLRVEYEIEYSDFVLPPLSLQPMVENAVKHGILKREEGGTVWISTHRKGMDVLLTIADDGVGFVPESIHKDGKIHVGFSNVKKRIEMQCKGTVMVKSKLNEGTIVTVTIPLI